MAKRSKVLCFLPFLVAFDPTQSFSPVTAFQPISLHQSSLPPLLPRTTTCRPLTFVTPTRNSRSCLWASEDDYLLDANDVELLQRVFAKYADKDGLMSKVDVMQVPAISQLLVDGDLLPEELTEIWNSAPKFPEVNVQEERIDVDSFVQLYRAIDDLFEDDEEEETQTKAAPAPEPASELPDEESELVQIFASIATDGTITKEKLRQWDEIDTLIADNMLGEDEFDQLWADACGSVSVMDEGAFMKFNDLLDTLFEFDDEDLDERIEDVEEVEVAEKETVEAKAPSQPTEGVVEGDVAPEELFKLLQSSEGVVGLGQLKRWGELQEMIADGDVLPNEVDEIFGDALTVSKVEGALDLAGFTFFCNAIDNLFEEEEEDEGQEEESTDDKAAGYSSLKEDLLRALNVMNNDDERLPCGLESTEREEQLILDLVTEIEKEGTNLLRMKGGDVELSDLAGEWEMLYTSSSAMKFNKGLSGLGGSFPNGRFGGLKQKLKATTVMTDVEYVESIEVNPSSASFEVKINGNWDLRRSVSLFTGDPSIVLSVEPDRVTYGPTSTRADHWKSLGPMNMLDVTYIDNDIRIMRGNTSVDTVFIFRRLK